MNHSKFCFSSTHSAPMLALRMNSDERNLYNIIWPILPKEGKDFSENSDGKNCPSALW